jgi:hypothetical protein
VVSLENASEPWREEDLDRYRLPHPVLGLVTVREMLMFTLFHFDHHRENVARRLEAPLSVLAERIPTSARRS